jgi:hypothetical protein
MTVQALRERGKRIGGHDFLLTGWPVAPISR